jgi:hypothetical protein
MTTRWIWFEAIACVRNSYGCVVSIAIQVRWSLPPRESSSSLITSAP